MSREIPKVKLQDGNEIPIVGLGTWRLFGRGCILVVKRGLELGYTHFDTAQMYNNESEIGRTIRGVDREKLFITSKVWYDQLHYKDVISACERSLRRLDTPYLDLYLIHWPNSRVPMKETLEAMAELHKRELVRSIGVSNFTIPHLEEALKVSSMPIVTNQVEFHPYLYERELLEYCNAQNIILTAWAPLARGKIFNAPMLVHIAKVQEKTVAQVALRWLIHKGVIVIPKASTEKHLKENIALFDWSLKDDEITAVDDISTEKRLIDPPFSQ